MTEVNLIDPVYEHLNNINDHRSTFAKSISEIPEEFRRFEAEKADAP